MKESYWGICSAFCTGNLTPIVIILIVLSYVYATRKALHIPPGPKIWLPVLGNIPSLVGKDVLQVFKALHKKYGDVFSIYMGSQLIVVLNGYDTIKEALVKNGKWFNDRPKNKLLTGPEGETGIIMSSGEFHKEQRKFLTAGLQKLALDSSAIEDRILTEVESLIAKLGEKGGEAFDVKDMITASVVNVIFGIVASKRFENDDEDFLMYHERVNENAELVGSTSVIVNCFPWLQYLPCDPFKMKKLVGNAEAVKSVLISPICDEHIATFDENNIRDLVDLFIAEMKRHESDANSSYNYRQLLAVFWDLLGAGSETTSTTIRWAILYLINYPEIQDRLRTDIINTIGNDRLPRMNDMKHLPYVEAFILEILRVANVAPLGVPHAVECDKDVVFRGYTIPKHCNIILNMQSIFKDPNIFADPETFNPDRFINAEGNVDRPSELISFGIGRRICAGENVAKMELFLFTSVLIQSFEFKPAQDGAIPPLIGELGITYKPKPFSVRISKTWADRNHWTASYDQCNNINFTQWFVFCFWQNKQQLKTWLPILYSDLSKVNQHQAFL